MWSSLDILVLVWFVHFNIGFLHILRLPSSYVTSPVVSLIFCRNVLFRNVAQPPYCVFISIFIFTTAFRTALGPTQPPIQWVPDALSVGLKRPGREADHSPPSTAEVKEWVELYLQSLNMPLWHGAQLKHRDNFTFIFMFTAFWTVVGFMEPPAPAYSQCSLIYSNDKVRSA
jgi:hypothetical protein